MLIPQEKISEIINASDIVDIISESVMLKKSGRNYFGLCPFHSEKSPSFSVSPEKQMFHCFGCKAGGNVFSFLMRHLGLSFPEAVKMAARRYNIQVETGQVSPERQRQLALKEGLFRLNSQVMEHYCGLLKDSPRADMARKYLEDRGITSETIERFSLGYALESWDDMVSFFRRLKLGRRLAEQSGLVLAREQKNGYYDRFRNRVIFPIVDISMQVAGFGGRVMDDSMPKYLNSPETPVYSKGRILYGLHAAKQYCRQADCVYIVEGYFDFLSLFQNGVRNTVASLGTALTSEHVRLLKGYASRAVLVFDSDDAGINAAKRSVATFVTEGLDVRILVLPRGQDPDSFVNAFGAQAFQEAAEKAMSVIDFLTETAVNKFGNSVEGRIAVLDEMKGHLASVEDSAARSLYVRELAQQLGIDESAVLEKVRDAVTGLKAGRPVSAGFGEAMAPEQGGGDEGLESFRRERQVLAMLLHYPEVRDEARKRGVLDYFYCGQLRRIGTVLVGLEGSENSLAAHLMTVLTTDEDRELVASLAMMDGGQSEKVLEKANFLMKRIVKVRNRNENTLANQIRRAEQGGDSQLPLDLLKKRQEEIRQLHGYK
ncbi:MAG: DNA primase [Desulfobacteraceae bacterium]|nr:DNA primase [Desulfobacteraceae bacterium]